MTVWWLGAVAMFALAWVAIGREAVWFERLGISLGVALLFWWLPPLVAILLQGVWLWVT